MRYLTVSRLVLACLTVFAKFMWNIPRNDAHIVHLIGCDWLGLLQVLRSERSALQEQVVGDLATDIQI